ncbi:hypothetical protein IC617_02115 [Neiella sp. HB171785]|uniref:Uncharacterized protein n=1 Tax=Neiella litorisoli TaxID=2771431 RepID=A0A8J6UDN6_9GAMM|nr:hypothetical protein [Neiella litorisoli]MBD1388214.1 hypothetical protein [Neiella litorisoli]
MEKEDEFLLEYYRNIRERLTSQGDRMWARFNYFLTIQSALIGAFYIRPESLDESLRLYALGGLGLIWSVLWFLIAAQDLWFYEDRYEKLRAFESDHIETQIGFSHVRSWHATMPMWKKLMCFKIPKVGSTTFSAICPFLFIVVWIVSLSAFVCV